MNLKALFEDEFILAIDKPSGLPSNTLIGSELSCESIILAERQDCKPRLLHRLDTGTSGVLLFAKGNQAPDNTRNESDDSVYERMRKLFQLKLIEKRYLAWTDFTPERKACLKNFTLPHRIDWPMAHHAKNKKKMIALPPEHHRHFRGKEIQAITVIHQIRDDLFHSVKSYRMDVEIKTGVMHQIRVHLASLGLALIGDSLYGQKEMESDVRLGLHAHKVSFNLNGRKYQIESPWEE